MATTREFSQQYTSFSGVDIKAVIDGTIAGTMQAISFAVQREKAPIYVMGSVDPLSFSRGKRGIAGTLISLLMDESLISQQFTTAASKAFIGDKDAIQPGTAGAPTATGIRGGDPEITPTHTATSNALTNIWESRAADYVDQLRPFDIAIVAANEYGVASAMKIFGVEILNEGSGFSIDDIVIESQMTYVCRIIAPWARLGNWSGDALETTP